MDTTSVTSTLLEERVAMYLQAIEYATAANDGARRQALEKDIQILMDLMERVSMGQVVPANAVPPPLQVHSHAGDPLANPLGELSSRLADYHKALYYADIEMVGENRTKQIQTLQRGLQVIQKLQEKAQAGYPIRTEEIPPPVPLPTDDEFVVDPKSVINERIVLYYQAIEVADEDKKNVRVKTLKDGIEKLHFLLKRAENNIPIYKKDLPCSPALGPKFHKETEQYRKTVELLTKMSGLSTRAAKLAGDRGDSGKERQLLHNAKMLDQALKAFEAGEPLDMSACPYSLADIERLADEAGVPASQHLQDAETVRLRCNQYKLEALKAKRCGDTNLALQHMRVVKGLQSLLHSVEKGESVDMTQVPPPPSEQTPTTEEEARILTQAPPDPNHHEERPKPNSGMDGMSLAEELSAFLFENTPLLLEGSSRSVSGSNGFSQGGAPPPLINQSPVTTRSPLMQQQQGQPPGQTAPPDMAHNSGLNPLYALTQQQNNSEVSHTSGLRISNPNISSEHQQCVPTVPSVPNRSSKPGVVSLGGESCPPVPERTPVLPMNGFHDGSGVVVEPMQTDRVVHDGRGREGEEGGVDSKLRPGAVESNGIPLTSSDTSCIEILKYERMQLDKEGSKEARVAAHELGRQMEETKQRLRVGGYEAWLAYLGQVERDVASINNHMKQAREEGEGEQLTFLVIKKELAERELAVMRKRLPELQT
ncbi:uncharacterized protein LOC143279966 [Babylonia areolata]|uniref:uncharacterized protein LOC143279966 n=1 Tax=Babylonia areolata TaxID=304850 RepID=UPI003FD3123E